MAVVLGVRVAIALIPVGIAAVRWSLGPGVSNLDREDEDLVQDPLVSDQEKGERLSAKMGTMVTVTTFADPFETRKLAVYFGRGSGGAVPEDDAVITFHFLKVVAGNPVNVWEGDNFLAIENAFDAVWGTLSDFYSDTIWLKQYRWYKAGPQQEIEAGGPGRTGPPVRVVQRNSPGLSVGVADLPPQVACSVSEKTSDPNSWGRFYLPNPMAAESSFNTVGHSGRWATPFITAVADAFNTFYDYLATGGTPVVVYSAAKAVRPSAGGGTLPARAARALTVDSIQVDDVPDVMRSRRFSQTLLRIQRDIG